MEMASTQSERVARQQHGIIPGQHQIKVYRLFAKSILRTIIVESFSHHLHIYYFSDSSGADKGREREREW